MYSYSVKRGPRVVACGTAKTEAEALQLADRATSKEVSHGGPGTIHVRIATGRKACRNPLRTVKVKR